MKLKGKVSYDFKGFVVVKNIGGDYIHNIGRLLDKELSCFFFEENSFYFFTEKSFSLFIKDLEQVSQIEVKEPSAREMIDWMGYVCQNNNCSSTGCPLFSKTDQPQCSVEFMNGRSEEIVDVYKKDTSKSSFRWLNDEKTEFEV